MQFKSIVDNSNIGVTIAKLAKDQEIDCECYAFKGVGKDHAKWNPVSVANF